MPPILSVSFNRLDYSSYDDGIVELPFPSILHTYNNNVKNRNNRARFLLFGG